MGFKISLLWSAPEVNPRNGKARSIPLLNPYDRYGRTFFFSWLGFLVAFLSWYAFPPLLTLTIRNDLGMSQNEYSNSNIMALTATLVVRLIAGPLCDKFGPRYVFVGTLLAGALPTALAGTVTTPTGIIVLRFFVGILGASLHKTPQDTEDPNIDPAQYFVMPAVFDSLVKHQHLHPTVAWRVSFIVPFIIITAVALGILFTGEDCPSGKWSHRHQVLQASLPSPSNHAKSSPTNMTLPISPPHDIKRAEPEAAETTSTESAAGEVIQAPALRESLRVAGSLQTLALAAPYACSFGGELAINSILGSYYLQNFPALGQTGSGRWAAMFGLLNVVFRPMGGVVADLIYHYTGAVWGKKLWIVFCGVATGAFELAIGLVNPRAEATMFGLVAGLAVFMDAANGANFAVVPHVHPFANGVLSGVIGAAGNLGGIIFAVIFRYHGKHYEN
ncbi:putative Nitrate transporter, partial [Diplocarpon rosae]